MNIVRENKDELNATLRIQIEKSDYEQQLGEKLKEYKRTVQMPGFRKGMVPTGMIHKMYRKPLLLDQLNKIVSESLNKYIQDEKLDILGEPLSSPTEQKPLDLDAQEEFEFVFDLGLAPKIEVKLSTKMKIPFYTVKVDDTMVENYATGYTSRFGKYNPSEVAGEEDLLKGKLEQLDESGEPLEGGIKVESAPVSIKLVADKKLQKSLTGAKVGDVFEIDTGKAFPNETDRAALLNVKKEELADLKGKFRYTAEEVLRFDKAEMNQELFDLVFGKDVIKTEDEFRARIRETILGDYVMDSNYKFFMDARDKIVDSIKAELPVAFLKRWILETNEDKITEADLEKDFAHFEKDLKWQMIRDSIIRENKIEVTPEEVMEIARQATLRQFRNYGMMNIPDNYLDSYAQETLKKEDERRKLYERAYHDKVIEFIKENVKLETKELSAEKFADLFKQEN
jgi:trigger factor